MSVGVGLGALVGAMVLAFPLYYIVGFPINIPVAVGVAIFGAEVLEAVLRYGRHASNVAGSAAVHAVLAAFAAWLGTLVASLAG